MKPLILASTSRYRSELLSRLAVPFTATPHGVDESALKRAFFEANPPSGDDGRPPNVQAFEAVGQRLAQHLALAKATALRSSHPDAWILGSDQLAILAGRVLGKPGSAARARQQLAELAGQVHLLCTATALLRPDGSSEVCLDVHEMEMRPLRPEEIDRYLATDKPYDCAGSYKIERSGIALFRRIAGEDFTAITGLPLMTVTRLLIHEGFPVPGPVPPEEALADG